MVNISALLLAQLADINWLGFYRKIDNELVLGAFQGKVTCIRIAMNKGWRSGKGSVNSKNC